MRDTMQQRQELSSPHITRSGSLASSATMEVVTDSCPRFPDSSREVGNSDWGPPLVGRRQAAWQEEGMKEPRLPANIRQQKTKQWVQDTAGQGRPEMVSVEKAHPMSIETQHFLSNMITTLREEVQSNTGVMALLDKPISVFEDHDLPTKDLDVSAQDAINQDLEDFLKQIREIRDGPEPTLQGDLAREMSEHLSEQRAAVEEAMAVLTRELTQDTSSEDELRQLTVERQPSVASEHSTGERAASEHSTVVSERAASEHSTVSPTNTQYSASQADLLSEPGCSDTTEPIKADKSGIPLIPKRMSLYELLDLHPDPKVRKAARKMKRLDEQLKLVIIKEKEVKKQHELLKKQLLIFTSGDVLVQGRTEVIDEGDDLTIISDLKDDVTPIFATQITPDESDTCSLPPLSQSGCSVSSTATSKATTKPSQRNARSRATPRSKQSNFSKKEDKKKHNNKNFIARNKELAEDASAAIAMTEAEKQRLQELLLDIDVFDENPVNNTVAIVTDEGFTLSVDEERRINEINNMLIIEEGSAMSVCTANTDTSLLSIQSTLLSELNARCPLEGDLKLGETALKTLTKNRSEQERIQIIDEMLARVTNEEEAPEVPRSVLDELLTQCRMESARQDSDSHDVTVL